MLDSLYSPLQTLLIYLGFTVCVICLIASIVYTIYAFITADSKASWGNVPTPSKADVNAKDSDNLRRLQEMAMLERAARLVKDGEIKK